MSNRQFQVGDTVRLVTPQFPDVNGRVGKVTAATPALDAYRVEVPSADSWADKLLARDGVRSALFSAAELVLVTDDAEPVDEVHDIDREQSTPAARQRLAADFAALAETGTVAHVPSSQAGLASIVPSLVKLDYAEAAARFAAASDAVIMLPAEVDRATQDAAFAAARATLDELEEASR